MPDRTDRSSLTPASRSTIPAPRQRRIAFSTLGCKLNQHEADGLATRFQNSGYRVVDFADRADAYVINTCTVTNRADRKSRGLTNRALRIKPEGSVVVLTGCFVDSHREELESDGRTFVVPNDQKHSIYELLDAHFRGEIAQPGGSVFDFDTPDRIFHTRTTVKVQDGCDNFCSFCIIPHVRGRAQSRSADDVVASVELAVRAGAREIVLTGVNMSRYDDRGLDFTGLLRECLDVDGDFRVRISSLEPDRLSDGFVSLFEHPKLAPHLHLCLQSASERILLAMRRQYTYAEYARVASDLRAVDPDFNLTTDIICGFPGETEAEAIETLDAIDAIGFGHVHTFPYSKRHGTRAERMPGHLPAVIRTERSRAIRERAEAAKRRYRASLVGDTERVLIEKAEVHPHHPTTLSGLGGHYVPVELSAPPLVAAKYPKNTFVTARIESLADGDDPALRASIATA